MNPKLIPCLLLAGAALAANYGFEPIGFVLAGGSAASGAYSLDGAAIERNRTPSRGGGYAILERQTVTVAALPGPDAPPLTILLGADTIELRWSSAGPGFRVESAPGLAGSAWQVLTNLPVSTETDHTVTLPRPGANAFFRLTRQP
jgi:hypothetical protein